MLISWLKAACTEDAATAECYLPAKNIDWDFLLKLISRHGLLPLINRFSKQPATNCIPIHFQAKTQKAYQDSVRKNLFLTYCLERLLSRLAEAGIEALPYKGPALAIQLYGDSSMRQFGDLDILVRPSDVKAAMEILGSEGFFPKNPVRPAWYDDLIRSQYHFCLVNREKDVTVELHWGLLYGHHGLHLEMDLLWEKTDKLKLILKEFPVPSIENLIFILIIHGFHHLWENLAWLADVHFLIEDHSRLDWACLLSLGTRFSCERMLLASLALAGDMLKTPLPPFINEQIVSDSVALKIAKRMKDKILEGRIEYYPSWEKFFLLLRERRLLRDKVKMAVVALISPSNDDLEFLPLPRPVGILYLMLRPLRLSLEILRKRNSKALAKPDESSKT